MAENKNLMIFKETCPEIVKNRRILVFQRFFCPISIVTADVKEYVIDEYDSVELLILRLYNIGLRTPKQVSQLTGIDENMVSKLLYSEFYTYGHINPETKELTDAGKRTINENTDMNNLFQHALYHVKRELQVDSLTGTLIKAEAELLKSRMVYLTAKMEDYLLPKESVRIDEELNREIHERLQFYIDKNYFSEGNTIESIDDLKTQEVKYRDAYFTVMEGFDYPFIVLSYTERNGQESKKTVVPIAIAEADFSKLRVNRESCKYLIRDNEYFEYIKGFTDQFDKMNDSEMEEDILKTILVKESDEITEISEEVAEDVIQEIIEAPEEEQEISSDIDEYDE